MGDEMNSIDRQRVEKMRQREDEISRTANQYEFLTDIKNFFTEGMKDTPKQKKIVQCEGYTPRLVGVYSGIYPAIMAILSAPVNIDIIVKLHKGTVKIVPPYTRASKTKKTYRIQAFSNLLDYQPAREDIYDYLGMIKDKYKKRVGKKILIESREEYVAVFEIIND